MAETLHVSGIVAIIFAFTSPTYGNNDSCLSPNKEAAVCLDLTDCQYLYEGLMEYPNISDGTANYIVDSICNLTTLTICCPERLRQLKYGDNSADVLATDAYQLPEPPKCGASLTDRIYGGVQAEMDEYPWMARLTYLTIYNVKDYYCGGALINSRHVLTAAHCIYPDYILGYTLVGVRLGEWNTTSDPDCEELANGQKVCNRPVVDVAIEWAKFHEHYDPYVSGEQNDIAVVRLAQAVSYTDTVKPICVPNPKEFANIELTGKVMDVAGWGETEQNTRSEIMLKTSVAVWQLDDCNEVYDAAGDVLIETQLCAGGKKTNDTCSGDSGGPLMGEFSVGRGAYFYVAGIVSYGPSPCGLPGVPGVYTNVVDFWHWIQATVAATN